MKQIVNLFALSALAAVYLTTVVVGSVNPAQAASTDRVATAKPAEDHIEKRIRKLHAELKITLAQEDLWENVAQIMRENYKKMDELTKERAQKAKTMTAVEDMKSYSEIADAHAEGIKKFIPPFEALYASMSDEQKKSADVTFRKHMRKKSKAKR